MNGDLQKRLYGMEVNPPAEVWNRLSAVLDEINADNRLSKKIYDAETTPRQDSWEKIKRTLGEETGVLTEKIPAPLFTLRRLAMAAIFLGLIVSAYFLFFNTRNETTGIATIDTPARKAEVATNIPVKTIPGNDTVTTIASFPSTSEQFRVKQASTRISSTTRPVAKTADDPVQLASVTIEAQSKDHIEDKVFNQPIDDLSLVASNSNYVSMVSADGRLVKIPSHLAGLAPYLQQKSGESDYMDILFEESTYWKDKFNEWRQKLAQSPVTPSIDNFFDIIGLLKTIQEN